MNDISLYGIRSAVRAFLPVLVLSIGLITNANAAPGGIPGPPDDGGGGMSPPDFGDLIFLYRDDGGVPILDANLCQQPIAFEPDTCGTAPIVCPPLPTPCLVPVNPDTCAVEVGYEGCTQEVEFGRINEARSPDTVFESQLEDVVVNLATADCTTLDPAGRMVATRVDSDLSTLVSTIDSPLQNLAISRQLILTGTLGAPLPQGASILNTAARGLGAASDKTGEVNVDLVVYLNQIMGLSDPATPTILDPKICIDVKEEVQGTVQLVEKCFLDFSVPPPDSVDPFAYDRGDNFSTSLPSLPLPAYIPETAPEDGVFEYMTVVDPSPLFTIQQGPILDAVFCVDDSGSPIDPVAGSCSSAGGVVDPGFVGGNIAAFAQAADDTRAMIDYMHTNQVPVEYETPVPCEASGVAAYDVAISDVSGLQVPKIIVDGSEGREFSVTVAHVGGSDAATGTVTVTATPLAGGPIEGSPWVYEFENLLPGTSQSFTQLFAISLGERTTINWSATAFASDDVNLANNTVTATSSVKVTGGGGGGPGGGQGGQP